MSNNNKKNHSYNSGRIKRSGSQSGQNEAKLPYKANTQNSRKKKRGKAPVIIAILLVLALLVVGVLVWMSSFFKTGTMGKISNKDYAPKEYSKSDVVHILIVGIDYEDGREYKNKLGLTDMIMYARFDLVNKSLNMLQIPRDSYVGQDVPTGNTGKINAALISGDNEQNPINNLVSVIENQFKLPVDHYISMDMDALKAIVDTFGSLRVYVPREMSHKGSYLPQGWQWLNGDATEFFVRNREGVGFERADIDRLDNQRHFYSALFRRFLNLTPKDIVNLLPVFEHYCNTDIKLTDIFDIAVSALNLTPENVMLCKVPGATGLDPLKNGKSLYVVDVFGRGDEENIGTAALLNKYFRSEGKNLTGEELGLPEIEIPANMSLYPPNIQGMANVQEGEGGADVDVEPKAE